MHALHPILTNGAAATLQTALLRCRSRSRHPMLPHTRPLHTRNTGDPACLHTRTNARSCVADDDVLCSFEALLYRLNSSTGLDFQTICIRVAGHITKSACFFKRKSGQRRKAAFPSRTHWLSHRVPFSVGTRREHLHSSPCRSSPAE